MAGLVPAIHVSEVRWRRPGWQRQGYRALARRLKAKRTAGVPPSADNLQKTLLSSVERFELDDAGAVVRADPEHRLPVDVLGEHAADVGRLRQQVFDERAGLWVEPRHAVV